MTISVESRAMKGKPCPDCPWRRDSVGAVDPSLVAQLTPCGTSTGPAMGCHRRPRRLCAGYVIRVGREDIGLAFGSAAKGVDIFRDVRSDVPLFGTFAEMFAAHGVTP